MLDAAQVKALVEARFRVYESRTERFGNDEAYLFYVMFPPAEFDARYEEVRQAIRAQDPDMLVFLRREAGEDMLIVARRPAVKVKPNTWQAALLVLTLVTTTMAGEILWAGFNGIEGGWGIFTQRDVLVGGLLWFALPLMAILGIHEMAHYVTARRHGLRATLPYFIPVPPFGPLAIGTFGAFIKLKDAVPDRKILFDVGASGPLAGFIVTVPVLVLGAMLTMSSGHLIPDVDRPEILIDGVLDESHHGETKVTLAHDGPQVLTIQAPAKDDWKYTAKLSLKLANGTKVSEAFSGTLDANATGLRSLHVPPGATGTVLLEWDDGLITEGPSLLVHAMRAVGFDDSRYLSHPLYLAGWVGLLVTGINLLPIGPLDGGHVARAVLGDKMRYAAYTGMGLLIVLGIYFNAWTLMTLLLVLMGVQHPAPLNDRTPLDAKRRALAWVVLAVLVLCFVPIPVLP